VDWVRRINVTGGGDLDQIVRCDIALIEGCAPTQARGIDVIEYKNNKSAAVQGGNHSKVNARRALIWLAPARRKFDSYRAQMKQTRPKYVAANLKKGAIPNQVASRRCL
jgi:hypothetical protein